MRLTGAEIVVEYLIREGVPYLVGIPGHGNVPLFDALVERPGKIEAFPVMHEQCAVHLADAYHRVSGQPLAGDADQVRYPLAYTTLPVRLTA